MQNQSAKLKYFCYFQTECNCHIELFLVIGLKTAVDSASYFKVGVPETLMKNFCVGDLLKSVESEDSVINFMMFGKSVNVVVLTLSLLPTEKVFLNQFQKITERMMSRTEILIESNQKKKASEICWDIERDTFKFQTDLKEKPVT